MKNKEHVLVRENYRDVKLEKKRLNSIIWIDHLITKANSPKDYLSPKTEESIFFVFLTIIACLIEFMLINSVPQEARWYGVAVFLAIFIGIVTACYLRLGKVPSTYAELLINEFEKYEPINRDAYDEMKDDVHSRGFYSLINLMKWARFERKEIERAMMSGCIIPVDNELQDVVSEPANKPVISEEHRYMLSTVFVKLTAQRTEEDGHYVYFEMTAACIHVLLNHLEKYAPTLCQDKISGIVESLQGRKVNNKYHYRIEKVDYAVGILNDLLDAEKLKQKDVGSENE